MERYHMILLDWKDLREDAKRQEDLIHLAEPEDPWPTEQLIRHLLSLPEWLPASGFRVRVLPGFLFFSFLNFIYIYKYVSRVQTVLSYKN